MGHYYVTKKIKWHTYPQFFLSIWHPLLYNLPSDPQVSLEIFQQPASQCSVVWQCLRSAVTTPCLKEKKQCSQRTQKIVNKLLRKKISPIQKKELSFGYRTHIGHW